jgi:hypothetical protein
MAKCLLKRKPESEKIANEKKAPIWFLAYGIIMKNEWNTIRSSILSYIIHIHMSSFKDEVEAESIHIYLRENKTNYLTMLMNE